MPFLDWVNKAQAVQVAADVPYHLLQFQSAHGAAENDNLLIQGAGLLTQKGRGSVATYYVPTEHLAVDDESLSSNPGALSSNLAALSSKPSALSTKLASLSTKFAGLSTKPPDLSTTPKGLIDPIYRRRRRPAQGLVDELPGILAGRIGAIGQRHPPAAVCDAIATCRLRDWRAEELATLLRRHSRLCPQQLPAAADAGRPVGDDQSRRAERSATGVSDGGGNAMTRFEVRKSPTASGT